MRTVATPKARCSAKDPTKCPYHGRSFGTEALTAENMFKDYVRHQREQAGVDSRTVVSKAVENTLGWEGKKPSWWRKYEQDAVQDPTNPNQPELLDVIDSPVGPLAVVWQEQSLEPQDEHSPYESGMRVQVCYYKHFETGETLGYVKMTSMTEATIQRAFGADEFTPFRYAERFGGNNYAMTDWDAKKDKQSRFAYRDLEGDALLAHRREVWYGAAKIKGVVDPEQGYIPSYRMSRELIPADDKKVATDLKEFAKEPAKQLANARKYYATPYVDYSSVEDPLRGKGFGGALYVYTARKLAQQGQALRGSGIQTDEAQGLWGKFQKRMPERVKSMTMNYRGEKSEYFTLDFRN